MPNTYTQLASDNFTRANENPLSGGGNWDSSMLSTTQFEIINNKLLPRSTNILSGQFWNTAALVFPRDQYCDTTISGLFLTTDTNDDFGALCRATKSGSAKVNGYVFKIAKIASGLTSTSFAYRLQILNNGIATTLVSVSTVPPPVTGDIIRVEVQGTVITGFYNGVKQLQTTDSTYASGQPGISMLGAATLRPSAINWDAGSITVPPAYYSVPDCRAYGIFPNKSRTVNRTLIYDVQTSSNSGVPSKDSRISIPVACGIYPQNCRTPGVFGPGE